MRVLVVAASLVLALAVLAGYAERAFVDSDQFANRATAALEDDSVRGLIATKITDEVVLANQADLLAVRPIIESAASSIVGGRAFTRLFRAAVRDVHAALFLREQSTLTLTVADVGTVLVAALENLRPELADDINASRKVEIVERDVGDASAKLAGIADDVRVLAPLLAVAFVLLAAGAVAVAPDRRRAVVELGAGAAACGVLLAVAYAVARGRAVAVVEGAEAQEAAGAVWDAFLADLRTTVWVVAGCGAVVAAAAASLIRPVELGEPVRRALEWIGTEPRRPALRVLRGVALVAAGVVVLVARDAVLSLALTALGAYLVFAGLSAILQLVYRPPEAAPAVAPEPPAPRGRRRLVPALVAVVIVAGAGALLAGTGATTTAAPRGGACNGHAELCDRRLDEVALVATHNSMSVPLPGWYSAAQDAPIDEQLEEGVRGLLIDTHYADRLPNGRLRTYFGSREELRRRARADGVSDEAVDAALRIRERLGFSGEGERGMYLCHSFCELGGTPLGEVLDDIRAFLVSNPDEVLVLINQDYVTPEDFVGAIREAGLEELVFKGSGVLTLREMIDRDERLVLLAENRPGGAPWYRSAYDALTQETPYSFGRPAELTEPSARAASCRPNRGSRDAPLFLLNHWVTTDPVPLPSQADTVNAYEPLLARARACRQARGRLPNLVAVNFYRRGDTFEVVDALNGLR
jgi:hypothetical protein